MPFVTTALAIAAIGGLATTGISLGESLANQPSAPSTTPQPLSATANAQAQSQARTAASQASPAPQGATGTQALEQQVLSQLFNGNPQYWGDVVAGVSQALGGGSLQSGPQASGTPGVTPSSPGGWNSILDLLSKSNPSAPGIGTGGGGGGADIASPLLSGLSNEVFHGFSA